MSDLFGTTLLVFPRGGSYFFKVTDWYLYNIQLSNGMAKEFEFLMCLYVFFFEFEIHFINNIYRAS